MPNIFRYTLKESWSILKWGGVFWKKCSGYLETNCENEPFFEFNYMNNNGRHSGLNEQAKLFYSPSETTIKKQRGVGWKVDNGESV